jgi:hypothetical protein
MEFAADLPADCRHAPVASPDMLTRRQLVALSIFVIAPSVCALAADEPTWKAGAAKAVITPDKAMWMAGYGSRTKPAEGKLHELWIKALALEDAEGDRAVIVSTDTLGIPRSIYENTCRALKEQLQFERSQIMLNASHTHCGPVLRGALYDVYPLDDEQRRLIEEYSAAFEAKLVEIVGQALGDLQPVTLHAGEGKTGFAVNRRNNKEPEVPGLILKNALNGPVDHSVPVLAVRRPDGKLKAIVFGYACHNTTMDFYQWSGDYAGFAQMALEESHPEAVAMFYMGCGADQNPLPRRHLSECSRYGRMLAGAVEEVLLEPMNALQPALKADFEFVTLNLDAAPSREELERYATSGAAYEKRWASRLLKQLDDGPPLARTYEYPIQAWKLGNQLWITLGGEVTVEYSLGFKKQVGPKTWVAGYCNDVMAYIPSLNVLEGGGYEGSSSMVVYGQPSLRWAKDIETIINGGVNRLVARVTASGKENAGE